jgi:hypothetical protein
MPGLSAEIQLQVNGYRRGHELRASPFPKPPPNEHTDSLSTGADTVNTSGNNLATHHPLPRRDSDHVGLSHG